MRVSRFHVPSPLQPGITVELPQWAAHHAVKVLRMSQGDNLLLFNGDGYDYRALLVVSGKYVAAEILLRQEALAESILKITLAQGISSGERMEFTLQKAVELGVHCIQPLQTQRSVVKLSAEKAAKRQQHWQHVVVSACEQSGRAVVPQVLPPKPLPQWLAERAADSLIMLDPGGERSLSSLPRCDSATLLIGPEGGFEPAERQAAQHAGALGVHLGPRILRTESAALAALSAMQTLWGDFAT